MASQPFLSPKAVVNTVCIICDKEVKEKSKDVKDISNTRFIDLAEGYVKVTL